MKIQKTLWGVILAGIITSASLMSALQASSVVENSPAVTVQVPEYPENTEEIRTLHVRGDYNYPPYEYLNEQRQPDGFNVDIMSAVAKAMGLKIKIDLGPWDEVRSQLEQGNIDALIGMFNTKERDKTVDFSIPHFIGTHAVFVRKDSPIQSIADAKGKKIILQSGDLGHDYVKENSITPHIIIKKDWTDTLKSLSNGEGDCAIVSRLQGSRLLGKLSITNIKAVGPPIIQRKYCLAVTEGNTALLAKLNEGLSIVKETGVYDEIYKKWFGVYEEQPFSLLGAFKKIIWIFLPLLTLAVAGFVWSWALKKQVSVRTLALRNELLERKRAEEALVASENKFRQLVETINDLIFEVNDQGNITYASPVGLKIWGNDPQEIVGKNFIELVHPEDRERLIKRFSELRQGIEGPEIYRFINKMGHIIWVRSRTNPVMENGIFKGARGVLSDITAQKQAEDERFNLERQLQQAQKAESLSRMAGAIAHHFNNQLAVVIGNLELTMEDLPPGGGWPVESLTEAAAAARRAAEMSGLMLTYLGQTTTQKGPMDLCTVCRQSLPLLRATLPETVLLETDFPSPGPTLSGNANQIQQVLTNLIINAWESIPDSQGGVQLTVKTVSAENIPGSHRYPIDWQPQDAAYACLAVIDAGRGIAEKDIEEIFDPFFTSKFTGRGLGLAVVLGILRTHNGAITVESEPGRGSIFRIFLPVSA